ncbi:DUF1524 domain-containing protein [Microbacterium sp. NPDC056234]|uniref:HNH endonuclease family protein n=1 Tax=Microbacterium sp. NPDC056234 TaxID=3345757 RepID=UPI0035D56AB2
MAVAIGVGVMNLGSSPAAGGPPSGRPAATPMPASTPEADAVVTPSPTASDPQPPTGPADQVDASARALDVLEGLAPVSGQAPYDYDRDLFGQRWADVDRNGCDTRNDILGRDLLDPVFKPGTRECKVLAGELIDPYDGSAVAFVSGQDTSVLVQIDHVVALAWAWEHGAHAWSDEQRTAFANDPQNLVAASQETNQSKSASGPAQWLPPEPTLRCAYVEQWVGVLGAYDLGIDDRERAAAGAVLRTC